MKLRIVKNKEGLLLRSRPARGAWVEIGGAASLELLAQSSRPARGAWVEIEAVGRSKGGRRCRAPQGARGLKWLTQLIKRQVRGRAPQGARGLK